MKTNLENYSAVLITIHNFGYDINCNTVAIHELTLIGDNRYDTLYTSKRRAQFRFSGACDEQCSVLLAKCGIDTTMLLEPVYSGCRAADRVSVTYPIKNSLTTDQAYIMGEFDKLALPQEYKCRLQITNAAGKTNYINITDEQVYKIKKILMQN